MSTTLNERQANALATIYGGLPWQPYPGIWLLVVTREDGSLVVFDNDGVCAYDNAEDLELANPAVEIRLSTV
ncbi:MAG: hypothetical protein ACPGYV_10315 [Phycisphaeraceae bacterium]